MPRKLPEWVGKTDDSPVPGRVQRRLLIRQEFACYGPCHRKFDSKVKPEVHHVVSLEAGGANREGNLQLWCGQCHKVESKIQTIARTKVNRLIDKTYGLRKRRHKWGIPGLKKKVSGQVVKR